MKNKLFLIFNKQAIIMEEAKMVQMTSDRVKRVALETIESEIPDVDYGCDYEKDVALAFMHKTYERSGESKQMAHSLKAVENMLKANGVVVFSGEKALLEVADYLNKAVSM